MKVQIYNAEMGTRKYVGTVLGFVSANGFVLAVVADEDGNVKCEKLNEIKIISESEKHDERHERMDAPGIREHNARSDGQSDKGSSGSKGFLRRGKT